MTRMDLEIRPIRPDEHEAYARATDAAFSGVASPEELEDDRTIAEFDRRFAAFDDGTIVGGSSASSFLMTVPGGRSVPIPGLTHVGVLPTHRRRGINTALMRAQLDDARRRGEPLLALHASEGGIYGRFGFGMATLLADLRVDTAHSAFNGAHAPAGRTTLLPIGEAVPRMRPVFDAVVPTRPGMIALDDTWFPWRFAEPTPDKDSPWFYAVHESDGGEPDAYAVYKVRHDWPGEIPRNELIVREVMASTPQATADIWRFVFDVDLVETVTVTDRPPDDPLLRLVVEPRWLRITLRDGMYLRLVDVPAALEARGYAGDGRIVLEVADAFCPENEGRYELTVTDGSAACRRTEDAADLACTVNELGAVYLGGSTFGQLAEAGRVHGVTEGAVSRADAILRSAPAPWCSLPF
jgi:predicted acetyltransferase